MFKKIFKTLNILNDVKSFLEAMEKHLNELNENVKDINKKIANLSERVSKLEGIVETTSRYNSNGRP